MPHEANPLDTTSMFTHALTFAATTPRIFRFVPPAVVWPYLAVAVVTGVVLTVYFHRAAVRRRRPTDKGSPAVATAFLFFPLMALAIVWPITLPAILIVTARKRRPARGFEVGPPSTGRPVPPAEGPR